MVDTPRTLDDILDLLADGGPVSAQDLRDTVVSITNPVVGGGFDNLGALNPDARFASLSYGSPFASIAAGYDVGPALTGNLSSYDPLGLLQSGSYISSPESFTFPASTWWLLPPGVWVFHTHTLWDTDVVGYYRSVAPIVMDNRFNDDGWDEWSGTPTFAYQQYVENEIYDAELMRKNGSEQIIQERTDLFYITQHMCEGGDVAIGLERVQDSGGARALNQLFITGVRIANVA